VKENVMSRLRLVLVLTASTLALAALAIVLMNREDEEDGTVDSAAALTAYFATMSAIDDKSDAEFDSQVFSVQQESARSYAEAFDSVLAMLESEYGKVQAPAAVETEHAALIEAIQDYRTGIDHGLRPLEADAPASEFEALFGDILSDEDLRVSAAFCNIQEVATAENITADVGCTQT